MTKATIAWPVVVVGGADDGGLGDLRVRRPAPTRSRWWRAGGRTRSSRRRPGRAARCRRPRPSWRRRRRSSSPGEPRPVGLLVPLVVAPDGAQHRRPRLGQHEVAAGAVRHRLARRRRRRRRAMPGSGVMAEPGLPAVTPGSGLIMIAPVSVCHQVSTTGRAVAADVLAVPDVGLGVDRLADRAEQPQRGQVELRPGSRRPTS